MSPGERHARRAGQPPGLFTLARLVLTRAYVANETSEQALPVGAEVRPAAVHFRVWAPPSQLASRSWSRAARRRPELARRGPAATSPGSSPASPRPARVPLPARRRADACSPTPPRASSPTARTARRRSIDPPRFRWTDARLARRAGRRAGPLRDARRHVHAARAPGRPRRRELPELAELGITAVEVMPVADFPGRFGWGYDGVEPVRPDAALRHARRLPARSWTRPTALGLGVILDVVYNHFGPDGNYLREFAPQFLSDQAQDRVGRAVQLRRPGRRPGPRVLRRQRRRTGSTSSTSTGCASTRRRRSSTTRRSTSSRRSRSACARRRRGRATIRHGRERAAGRRTWSAPPEQGGYGLDALWNDDFHHAARVALTGKNEAYFTRLPRHAAGVRQRREVGLPVPGAAVPLAQAAARHARRSTSRGTGSSRSSRTTTRSPTPAAGCRLHQLTSPARYRAMTAYLLLGPGTPMLFQGQEYASIAAVPLLRRPQPRPGGAGPRGPPRVLRRFRSQSGAGGASGSFPTRPTRTRSSAASSTRPSASRGREWLALHKRPARAAEDGPGVPRGRRSSTARSSATRRSCCASSCPTATTGCWS